MRLRDVQRLELPPTADMHVHLRQDKVMELVVPQILKGGVDTVFVMPNLQPPITSVAQALEYQSALRSIEPRVHYLMSLYLHPSITPEVIAEAAAAGIAGVKMYPQGVTTNSESGVPADFLSAYSPVFAAMEEHDLVLNLHGEWPGPLPSEDISLEEAFLPELKKLHEKFPRLRCVLEHCSTAAALDAVRACGPSVAGTITAHHLYLTGDDSHTDPLAFCKPIPKKASDRDALIKAACSGDPKFFFGSDSAPHPLASKVVNGTTKAVPAGVFTQPFATQLVLLAFEEAIARGVLREDEVTQDQLERFLSRSSRRFYKLPVPDSPTATATDGQRRLKTIVLERKGETIPPSIRSADGAVEIGVSKAAAPVFSLSWLA
ncbi:dihydroorotase, homodimeric type [Cladophialophora immunda]|uniref:dihydroorotase n=1 Tax=Cladophialophora immunda TaxID=569365 RepID=A0A0D2CBQ5_9EURO|nr:dihydroorotase, homodimeric type [Cladophialophora immunda]KIW28478.1 dihydroorotase, homodimeric type [Cladophialophora immunda]